MNTRKRIQLVKEVAIRLDIPTEGLDKVTDVGTLTILFSILDTLDKLKKDNNLK